MVKMENSWYQAKEREDKMVDGSQVSGGRDVINRGGKYCIGVGEEQGFSWGHGTSVMSAKSQKKRALNVFAKRVWKRSQG